MLHSVDEHSFRSEKYILRLKSWLWKPLRFFFGLEVFGLEKIPEGPCLFIANHNAGALIESHSLVFLLQQKNQIYGLNHQSLMKIPLISHHFRKIGAVSASETQALQTLKLGHSLLIFPGGNRQALRPLTKEGDFTFPWAKGWAEIAQKTQVPVVPVKFIGSHRVNPVFLNSKFLSRLLILPALLKVRYFPISLSQILFAAFFFGVGYGFQAPPAVTLIMSYFAFCLTPLVPILPSRIRIQIEPPLFPQMDYHSAEELRGRMQEIMALKNFSLGPRKKYALNAIERFMLYHESENLSYNSQLVFEFESKLEREKMLATTNEWIESLPQVRSTIEDSPFWPQRYSYKKAWFQASDIFSFSEGIQDKQMDQFCCQKFHLGFEPAVRFLLQSEGERHRLIFSCHHSLFDGAAQIFSFEAWAQIYNGHPCPKALTELRTFRYRDVVKKVGIKTFLSLLWKNRQVKAPRDLSGVASLNTKEDNGQRFVTSRTLKLPQSLNLRLSPATAVLRAFDQTLQSIGDLKKPIVALVPQGLRFHLKVNDSLQNILTSQVVFSKRQKIQEPDFHLYVQSRISANPLLTSQKFIFGTLPVCSLFPACSLRSTFRRFDASNSQSVSLLLVHAPVPKTLPLPSAWNNILISARGTLLKSPSVGIVLTGPRNRMTLTVEYVSGLVEDSTIEILLQHLKAEFEIGA